MNTVRVQHTEEKQETCLWQLQIIYTLGELPLANACISAATPFESSQWAHDIS